MRRGCIILALVAPALAHAAPPATESPAAVAAAVRAAVFAGAPPNATIRLGPVQGAAYMPACNAPLAVGISGDAPYQQALVRCAVPGWNLYVSVTVASTALVVTAARPIAAGQSLVPADLVLSREPVSLYAGRQVFYDAASLAGSTAAFSLPAGAILTSTSIDQPMVVQAGQTVAVTVQCGAVELSVTAIANQSGRIGDTILMTNQATGKRFSAQVTANGPTVQLQS